MNGIRCLAFGVFCFFLFAVPEICAQSQKERVAIGVLVDDRQSLGNFLVAELKKELDALLGAKYHIQILEDNILSADWSASVAAKNYDHLMEDGDIDIIIGFGVLTSSVIAQRGTYQNPLLRWAFLIPNCRVCPRLKRTDRAFTISPISSDLINLWKEIWMFFTTSFHIKRWALSSTARC